MSEIVKVTDQQNVNTTSGVDSLDGQVDASKLLKTPDSEVQNDKVSLTNTAIQLQALQQTLPNEAEVDSQRVEALRVAIADGSYSIDVDKLAQNLIEFEKKLIK